VAVEGLFHFVGPAKRRLPVLEDVSFELAAGEFLCIMGPSGSGKSTLLHLIAGLDRPEAGQLWLAGVELAERSGPERTRLRRDGIGYVFQFFNLLPNLTVLENVGLPLAIRGLDAAAQRERCQGLLDRFGVGDRAGAFPHELSGGEMQRVSIARALAGDQPLLVCDEPTGNLSQQAGQEIMRTLRQVCDEDGRSVLLVTHNPRDASFADRVVFLVDGHLAEGVELRGPDLPIEAVHQALEDLGI
jgi:putative ABC transport system ATP-binding protein